MGWVGVDFDGTLVQQDAISQFDPSHIGEPVELMVSRVRNWLSMGKDVRIFTARVSGNPLKALKSRASIDEWCKEHLGQVLPVTCIKEKDLIVLYDDKAIQVEKNTGKLVTLTPHGLEEFPFSEGHGHCSNHAYFMNGCADCGMYAGFKEKYESKLQKSLKVGLHPLEIKPGEPGPRLQLIRQQTTRKIFLFLYNAQSDVIKALKKKAKELAKISDEQKRDLLLGVAIAAIGWAVFVEEMNSDLFEATKAGITNGLEQLAETKSIEEIDSMASEYAKKRAAEMVSKQWEDNKLVDLPNARYSIADTTKDDIHDIIEQSIEDNSVEKIADQISESGIFSRNRAELIAKTEIAMAQAKGNLDIWKQSAKIEKVNVVVSANHIVEDLCDEHVAGNPWDIEKAPQLPLHPHCACSLVAHSLAE